MKVEVGFARGVELVEVDVALSGERVAELHVTTPRNGVGGGKGGVRRVGKQ